MDFFSFLPLELVVQVLEFVRIRDVLLCMRACKEWYEKIRHLRTYWKVALSRLGVSPALMHKNIGGDSNRDHYTLALNVWKVRQYIVSSTPEIVCVSYKRHHRTYFQCTYCRHGTLVATLYNDFIPSSTLVYKIQPGSKQLVKKNQFPPIIDTPLGRVCWSSVYIDYLLIATACGRWLGYDLSTNVKLLDWEGSELYDQDILICCCEYCYLVVTAKLVSDRKSMVSYWEVDVVSLGRGYSAPMLSHFSIATAEYIPPSHINYGCRNLAIVSKIGSSAKESFCCSHLLLLQFANTVAVHEMKGCNQINECPVQVFCCTTGKDNAEEMFVSGKYHNTPFHLSADNSLCGFIFADMLSVWNLNSLSHESTVNVQRPHKNVQVCLLAVGHLYSLIGYESSDGQLKVVLTYSGKCIFSTHGFSGVFSDRHQSSGTPPPYFSFLGLVDEHWLSNVYSLPNPSMPIILYWEKRERSVFGIMFKPNENL